MNVLTVHDVIFRTDDLFELQLERRATQFEPGACVALFSNTTESRPYSIAAGSGEDVLRFLIRRVPNGIVSNWLAQRQPGDKVSASEPFGWFRPGRAVAGTRSVFIATGTGIAPFLSYLRSNPQRQPELCLYGVRLHEEALNLEELQQIENFRLALSQEEVNGHFHGRITGLLEQIPFADDIHYYLCGLDTMIDETSIWLENHGVAYTQIHREIFFYEDGQL
ncbi:MAG: FAD-binding oxidoreductase [Thermodesulfobacteriota bacterium]|nr:FAD-binding oxidoreductase [Thermodesulfobacteriota bacterium]